MPEVHFTPTKPQGQGKVRFTPTKPASLLESRREASKGEFEQNQPESTLGTRTREAALGILEPLHPRNISNMIQSGTGALWDAVSGKGTKRAQELVGGAVMAPIEPLTETIAGLSEGDYDRAAHGTGGILSQTVPAAASLAVGGKPAVRSLSADMAERLYESALKPGPRSNTLPQVRRMVGTGLRERIPVTERGTRQLRTLSDELNQNVAGTISSAPHATVSKFRVASRLNDTADRFATQVNPESDLAALSESGNEFLRTQPNSIPAAAAQRLKQGTYRQLKDRAFGELKNATVESQKGLARGLKEELEALFPEIREVNARNSDLFQLEPELESAVNRTRNKEMFGIGTPIFGGAVGVTTGSAPLGALAGIARHLIDRPGFKSRLAIALSRVAGN